MCAFTALEDFIARASAHKVLTIVMQTSQVTQTMNFPKSKPKTILDIGLWSPCTKHGNHTFYPCPTFVKAYA